MMARVLEGKMAVGGGAMVEFYWGGLGDGGNGRSRPRAYARWP